MREGVGLHKIFDNLCIISNNVQPEDIEFELVGDAYLFNKARLYREGTLGTTNLYKELPNGFTKLQLRGSIAVPYKLSESVAFKNVKIKYDPILDQYDLVMNQPVKNIETYGRRLGNIHYKEDMWYLTINPIVFDKRINNQDFTPSATGQQWTTTKLRDK